MSTASAYSTSPLDETRRSQDLIHGPPVPERPAELSLGNISTPLFPSTLPNPNSNRSNLFPPAYHSIATPSASAIQASQASRNLEKQALRDAWREQAESLVHVPRGQVPRTTGPPSVEPSSDSNSSGENRERVGLGINGAELSPVLSNLSGPAQQKGFRHRGILPKGMDVREALAKCEDPALGWSLQFWVTIADPSVSLSPYTSGQGIDATCRLSTSSSLVRRRDNVAGILRSELSSSPGPRWGSGGN